MSLPQTLRRQVTETDTQVWPLIFSLCPSIFFLFCFETWSYDGALAGMKLTMSHRLALNLQRSTRLWIPEIKELLSFGFQLGGHCSCITQLSRQSCVSKKEAGQCSQRLHRLPADKEPWPNRAPPQGLPYISGLMEGFTKRMKFFWTGNYCWNTTFSRVKCKWIRNTWLKFPSKLNSYGLWYKGENCVFPNMAWVLKTSKCWENGVGTQLTFNYDHNHSSITWQNVIQ